MGALAHAATDAVDTGWDVSGGGDVLPDDDFGLAFGRGDADLRSARDVAGTGASRATSDMPERRQRGTGVFPQYERAVSGASSRSDGPGGARGRARGEGVPGCDAVYLPPGWPEQVRPPESPDWEQSAVAFLLDCCPADYRAHLVLRRHPVVLASLAGQFVESQIRAGREALAGTRATLGRYVSSDVLDDTVEVLHVEQARLVRVRRAVALVEEALRGRVFIRRL